MLQTCTKAGGGVRDHGGGVGTALLRYLQLNVGKTNFGTFLAYFFHLGSQLLVHVLLGRRGYDSVHFLLFLGVGRS